MIETVFTYIINNFITLALIIGFVAFSFTAFRRNYAEQYVEKADIGIDFTKSGDFQIHGTQQKINVDNKPMLEETKKYNSLTTEQQAITDILKQKLNINIGDIGFDKKYQQYSDDYQQVKKQLLTIKERIQQQQQQRQNRLNVNMHQFIDKAYDDFIAFDFNSTGELIEEIRLLDSHNIQHLVNDNNVALTLQQANYYSLNALIAQLNFNYSLAYYNYISFYQEIEKNISDQYINHDIRLQQLQSLNHAVGLYIGNDAHHDKIKKYVELAGQYATQYFEHGQPDALEAINNLGIFYQTQKQYDAASELYAQTMQSNIDLLGHEHPNTLTSINNLGYAYQSQKRYDEAHKLYKEALEVKSRVLGRNHPSTLVAINNLGRLYQAQGLLAEASPLYEEALEKSTEILGRNHPETLTTINNLALLYQESGDLDKSDELYQEALKTRQDILGENHQLTLLSTNNLAVLHYSKNEYVAAEKLLKKALKGFKKTLKSDHEYIAIVQQNISFLKNAKKGSKTPRLARL